MANQGRAVAASLGLAAVALLPGWEAILALPAAQRDWIPVVWLLAATLLLAAAVLASTILRGWHRWLLGGLVSVVMALLLVEMGASFYISLKDALAFFAGAHYRAVRNLVGGLLAVCLLVIVVYAARRGLAALVRAATDGLALLAALPVVLVLSYLVTVRESPPEVRAAERTVVVLVFDELDDSYIAAGVSSLPNFAALRRRALSATQMYPPANYTSESLPGMLTGSTFVEALTSRREVHVREKEGGPWLDLSSTAGVFSDARQQSLQTDLIGWHLPYCSMYRALASCWDDASFRAPGKSVGLLEWLLGQSRLLAMVEDRGLRDMSSDVTEYSRGFFATSAMYRLHRIGEIFGEQRRRLLLAIQGQQRELVFAHLACPHAPSMDKEKVGKLDMYVAYSDNLQRCDTLLGEVIAALEAGVRSKGWALVVTSDHWFRGRDWREAGKPSIAPPARRTVPFYVLVNGEDGRAYSTASLSNSRVLRRLVAAASETTFSYEKAKSLIETFGDAPTVLRPF